MEQRGGLKVGMVFLWSGEVNLPIPYALPEARKCNFFAMTGLNNN